MDMLISKEWRKKKKQLDLVERQNQYESIIKELKQKHEEMETQYINEWTNLSEELEKLHEEINSYKQTEEIDKHHHNLLITNIEKHPVMNNLL